MIADDVVAQLSDSRIFSRAEVVKPGFINLDVKPEFVAEYMNKMAEDEKLSVETARIRRRSLLTMADQTLPSRFT